MDAYQIIRRPLVTEKGTHQAAQSHAATARKPARSGSFAFEVHPEANKSMIKGAIETIYKVKVLSVRTANRPGKYRRYRLHVGRTPSWKKATVVLHADDHIDLF